MGFSRQEYWSRVPLPSLWLSLGSSESLESSLLGKPATMLWRCSSNAMEKELRPPGCELVYLRVAPSVPLKPPVLQLQIHLQWKVKVAQSCSTPCNLMDYTVHAILQARILEWVDFPSSNGSSQPRDQTQVSRIAGGFFTSWAIREAREYWSG